MISTQFLSRLYDVPTTPTRPPPPIKVTPEVRVLAQGLVTDQRYEASSIACLWHLCFILLTAFGAAYSANLTPMVDLLRVSLHQRARDDGLPDDAVPAALQALQQAGETAAYLHSLPD
jgi:hypothetical protein